MNLQWGFCMIWYNKSRLCCLEKARFCPGTGVSSVQSLSHVWLFATLWTVACQASLSITNSQSLPEFMFIELVVPSNHLILHHPLLLPSIFPSIRVFSNESALHIRWPKYWSFTFNISPSNEHPGLISFRKDWLDLLAVQGTHERLLQHHSSKASILQHSAFFTVQLSHPYMTTGKTIALTKHTFFGKVMSLLFNMLSRLVITFLPRSKRLLISWLQSSSVVILEPPKIKSATVSTVSPSISHEVMGPDAMNRGTKTHFWTQNHLYLLQDFSLELLACPPLFFTVLLQGWPVSGPKYSFGSLAAVFCLVLSLPFSAEDLNCAACIPSLCAPSSHSDLICTVLPSPHSHMEN